MLGGMNCLEQLCVGCNPGSFLWSNSENKKINKIISLNQCMATKNELNAVHSFFRMQSVKWPKLVSFVDTFSPYFWLSLYITTLHSSAKCDLYTSQSFSYFVTRIYWCRQFVFNEGQKYKKLFLCWRSTDRCWYCSRNWNIDKWFWLIKNYAVRRCNPLLCGNAASYKNAPTKIVVCLNDRSK